MNDGRKDDAEKKERWDLLPVEIARAVVRVLGYGAKRYGDDNWRKVDNARERYFAAALRHLMAWRAGEEMDPESGEPHLAHAICSAMFLATLPKGEP